MKKTKLSLYLGMALLIFFGVFCKNDKKGVKASDAEAVLEHQDSYKTYVIDTTDSHIAWVGSTPVDGHNGTIKFSSGKMGFENGILKSGSFEIDINSIAVLDLKDLEENGDLVEHLKNEDFFEVDKFPKGQFDIVSVSTDGNGTTLKGNLTLKEVTKSITFPVDVLIEGNKATLTSAPFFIDRTEWGIIYESGTFFKDLKDEFIKDEIEITLDVKGLLK
ncbi:YceI family protein [Ulvibacterium sp.]|uniref:YceI family protein n=1 Tax=Ulvibacterium sp. TaxID=2665914 RepID=UPI002604BF6F|nr:YceI family protein [Ulvibacterium sp.]